MQRILPLLLLGACATLPEAPEETDPNAGLLRDFLDGKFDGAGHPLNARSIDAQTLCGGQALTGPCTASLVGTEQHGDMQVNAHPGPPVPRRLGPEAIAQAERRGAERAIALHAVLELLATTGDRHLELRRAFHKSCRANNAKRRGGEVGGSREIRHPTSAT